MGTSLALHLTSARAFLPSSYKHMEELGVDMSPAESGFITLIRNYFEQFSFSLFHSTT